MRIGIDLLGSDTSPHLLIEAVFQAALTFDATHTFVVFATSELIAEFYKRNATLSPQNARLEYHQVSEVVTMHDEPLTAIRQKKGSSLVIGIRLLKKTIH